MEDVVVLMPFREPWSDGLWAALEKIAIKDTRRKISIYRVDMMTSPDQWLADHIEGIDRGARIVIADLTIQNPSMFPPLSSLDFRASRRS